MGESEREREGDRERKRGQNRERAERVRVTEVPALCLSSRELGGPLPVSSPTRVSSLRAALAPALPGVLQASRRG